MEYLLPGQPASLLIIKRYFVLKFIRHRPQEISSLFHAIGSKECLAFLLVNFKPQGFVFASEYPAARVVTCEKGTESLETYQKDSIEPRNFAKWTENLRTCEAPRGFFIDLALHRSLPQKNMHVCLQKCIKDCCNQGRDEKYSHLNKLIHPFITRTPRELDYALYSFFVESSLEDNNRLKGVASSMVRHGKTRGLCDLP